MKDSEILRKARELIANGDKGYICNAIDLVALRNDKLPRWIEGMLGEYRTLEGWLAHNTDTVPDLINPNADTRARLRDLRLRWLDWMIQYCELEEAGWTPWLGGETEPETCSEVMLRDGFISPSASPPDRWRWSHLNINTDIIAYKP